MYNVGDKLHFNNNMSSMPLLTSSIHRIFSNVLIFPWFVLCLTETLIILENR